MNADHNRLKLLLEAYRDNRCSREELEELVALSGVDSSMEVMQGFMEEEWKASQPAMNLVDWEQMYEKIIGEEKKFVPVRKMKFVRWVAAAVVIALAGIGTWIVINDKEKEQVVAVTPVNDALPGKDGAILTLADGRQIVLDDAANGKITDVAVKDEDQLSYEHAAAAKVEYNTMTTPRGRQYSLILSDGSKVWLNAASSITFPTVFTGNERRVEVEGEVYFEVAHNAASPFVVTKDDMSVAVLGTHFNVNSYDDEDAIKVTLMEGSVEVNNQNSKVKIRPGEQAIVRGEIKVLGNMDTDRVMAWREGLFHFEQADLREILRQFSRWYDVEVVYEGKIPERKFFGIMNRNATLAAVLKALRANDVAFKIEGKTLTIEGK